MFRFDSEVSLPISAQGSRFRIGPLLGPDARVRVQILHVPAGGLIGRHDATRRQLLAVMAGSGWASGKDGARSNLTPGYAVLWERDEAHEAGSEGGLMAVGIEGEFEVWAHAVTQDIVVCEYDPEWCRWFEDLRARIWPVVEDVALRIDHVGSTAVEGMTAKPIIDLDVVVASDAELPFATERLRRLGYRWQGDLGVEGRQAFAAPADLAWPEHHLYLVVENNKAHLDHWLLRDLLRSDPEARERYGALKRRTVEAANGNMDFYVAAKASLVAELLTRARRERGLPPETYWLPEVSKSP
jgi:GrpB-like predicted nucleotidyltransferase (UPF0157 family)